MSSSTSIEVREKLGRRKILGSEQARDSLQQEFSIISTFRNGKRFLKK